LKYIGRSKTITTPATGEFEPALLIEVIGELRLETIAGRRCLVIPVHVVEAGRFNFYGDLCDGDEQEIGYVRHELELGEGRAEVALPMVLERDVPWTLCGFRIVRRKPWAR